MTTPLRLFNSLTRQIEDFEPLTGNEARVYTCGPTVYNFQHIGNMRAYIFADTLGRALSFKGYGLKHVINITDVGHLTSDADAGDDKMEKAASAAGRSAWDIAKFYTDAYWRDIERLNIRQPMKWSIASDYVPTMIEFAKGIADAHCYQLDSGLYFDTSTVPDYGRLARAATDQGESRIDPVDGKRNAQDFAIWRTTPRGETRQMEWDSPWGKGAPGWHLECSVMSEALLGLPFDIHTGGIDHREIHHPNEIAQNQAHCGGSHTGAHFWMHNNFLIDRTSKDAGGKMSKSSGEFLTLQALIDRGFHPLAYRLMCLQAHYRSEMEFTWEGLAAAFTRLKRMVMAIQAFRVRHAELVSASMDNPLDEQWSDRNGSSWTLKQVQGDDELMKAHGANVRVLDEAISSDLSTPETLTDIDMVLGAQKRHPEPTLKMLAVIDSVLGLNLLTLTREDLRIRPVSATLTEADVEARLTTRKAARAAKDFATSDRIRDELIAAGVDVMDGDPLGWDWRIEI